MSKNFYLTSDWLDLREACLLRDRYFCQVCGKKGKEHEASNGNRKLIAHHIVPRKLGGQDSLDNLQTVCAQCHVQLR